MSGFIDIHAHILPGVDGGARDILEARQMIRIAWQDETRGINMAPVTGAFIRKINRPSS